MSNVVVRMHGITKRFGDQLANDHIDFTLRSGSIHAVVGENGAGKTTLMKSLYGMVQPDGGTIEVDGKRVVLRGPADAMACGIGMVHQHFMIAPSLTVGENIVLGRAPTRRGLLDRKRAQREIREVAGTLGFDIDPSVRAGDLSVGMLQRVEIIKALYRGARVLILDEPTAVLTPQEALELGRALRGLSSTGTSVIFITHKLKEVTATCDVATILRRGRVVAADLAVADTTPAELSELMVGRQVAAPPPAKEQAAGPVVLDVQDLTVRSDRRHVAVDALSLTVRAGTIVGVAGVEGNGQTELVEAIAGLRRAASGRISLNGTDTTRRRPRDLRRRGLAHIPEDRQARGVAESCSITDNLLLDVYRERPYSRFGLLRSRPARARAAALVDRFGVACAGVDQQVGSLSGGNIQKVVVARETGGGPALVLAAQPTRGVDIGAIEFIHRTLAELRDGGAAILLVSAELDELMALSDVIHVMYEGRIVLSVPAHQATELEIGSAMAGAAAHATAGGNDVAIGSVEAS